MDTRYVLIIMPEPLQRRRIGALLAATGQRVEDVGSRDEALAAVHREAPHIVVLDLALPGAETSALVHELREACGDPMLPILAVCGAFGRPTPERLAEDRLLGPIVKPVTATMLLRTLLDATVTTSVSSTWISRPARDAVAASHERVLRVLLGVADLVAHAHRGAESLAMTIRPCLDLCGCVGASVWTSQPGARLELVARCGAPEVSDAVVDASFDSPGFFERIVRTSEPVRIDHDAAMDVLAPALSAMHRGQVTVLAALGETGAGHGLLALTADLEPGEREELVELARGLAPTLGMLLELDRQRTASAALAAALAQQRSAALTVSGIAHDLRNVLTVVVGSVGFLAEAGGDAATCSDDQLVLRDAAAHAVALSRRLSTAGSAPMGESEVVPASGVLSASRLLLQRVLGNDIALMLGTLQSQAWVRIDTTEIQRVLINLATNAREAMPSGGRFVLDVADVQLDEAAAAMHPGLLPGVHALITVSDSGCGMDAACRAHLFEAHVTTRPGRGTGLGLYTSREIVRRHGGTMDAISEPGNGTTFRIFLPQAAPASGSADLVTEGMASPVALRAVDVVTPADTRLAEGSLTILVVEDDANLRRLVALVLRNGHYRLLTAGSGDEALAVAARHEGSIDLLLSDLGMPGLDPRTAAERLRELRPGMRTLFMSGTPECMVSRAGSSAWTGRLLLKPFTPAGLLGAVRGALGAMTMKRPA